MKLGNKTLDDWFCGLKKFNGLPEEFDFPGYYIQVKNQLDKWVHPYVNEGAMIIDGGYLTDHGPDHIKKVIDRLTHFVNENPFSKINHFETLILLLSAHIHDVGNIFGRQNHEITALEVIEKIGTGVAGQFKLIWDIVFEIASAHKGSRIELLPESDNYLSFSFRPQLLAAMLKFADELSEDCSRARRFAMSTNIIKDKVPEAELYHQYAGSLRSVDPEIKIRTIKFKFLIEESLLEQKFKKNENGQNLEIYLIDEIYLRTLKAHDERVYCMKFMRPYVNFDKIDVSLTFRKKSGAKVQTAYTLDDTRLSAVSLDEFLRLNPKMEKYTGEKILKNIEELQ